MSRTWERAEAAGDKSRWRKAYARLGVLIERGGSQVDRETELMSLLERRRKLVDSEVKRPAACPVRTGLYQLGCSTVTGISNS